MVVMIRPVVLRGLETTARGGQDEDVEVLGNNGQERGHFLDDWRPD